MIHHYNARLLTSADINTWTTLRREGVERFPFAFLPNADELSQLSGDRDKAALEAGSYWGVFHAQTAVGIAGLRAHWFNCYKHRFGLGPFYVTPDHWGSPAATTLMVHVFDTAAARGATQIELEVDAENPRAIAFYEKMGFQQIGQMPNAMQRDGTFHDVLLMVRQIVTS